ncbi:MAG: signal peptidase I [Clostridia bacterium]|nr:signal peptidase I [Clostridia bacterium]
MKRALCIIAAAAVICALLRLFIFHTARITGSSMERTLNGGDVVLVYDLAYAFGNAPQRGDIVECTFPERSGRYVKRLIGLPGDRIEIRENCVYINGEYLSESYVSSVAEDYAIQLGADDYFVLGDNRADSYDSRAADMGTLKQENIHGRVLMKIAPLRKIK